MADVALLPTAVQKLRHLRIELDKGIGSLERDEVRELDIEEFIRRAHQQYERA